MKNKTVTIINTIIFCSTALAGLVFAAIYLFRPEFMPYHAVAVGKPWHEVGPEFQVLILALMHVAGGGFLATSTGIIILLLFPYRRGRFWPNIGIPAIGMAALIPTLIATIDVKTNSMATPPYLLAAGLIGLLVLSIILSLIFRKDSKPEQNN